MARRLCEAAIPEHTRKELDYYECDLCGKRTSRGGIALANWAKDAFDHNSVEIVWQHGSIYPDDDFTEWVIFDICPECFESRVMPALEEMGASPRRGDAEDVWR